MKTALIVSKKNKILPVFIPMQGCRYRCIYCNQSSITGIYMSKSGIIDSVKRQINEYLSYRSKYDQIAFYGGTFSFLPENIRNRLFKLANDLIKMGKVSSVRISTAPDGMGNNFIDYLSSNHVSCVELGVQILDDSILNSVGRCQTSSQTISVIHDLKQKGIKVVGQTMLGLPGSNFDKEIDTAKRLINAGIDAVRIYPLYVFKDTPLFYLYQSNKYIPLSLNDAVKRVSELLILYNHADVKVIRVGLPVTGRNPVAGPYHPALKSLAETLIYRRIISSLPEKRVEKIYAKKEHIPLIFGINRKNRELLERKFIKKISILQDEKIKDYRILWMDDEGKCHHSGL